jgi:Chaperone of endosialidase
MNHSAKSCSALIYLIAVMASAALAQQPPDPVKSDSMANTAMGTDALLHVDLAESGCHNTASGEDALYSDTSGSYNTATGFSSLYSNTTGSNNTAAGYESLYYNTTGDDNTASGYQALHANTTGGGNTASGYQALLSNTTGGHNTAIGDLALYENGQGSYNTALGFNAGHNQTNGHDDIYIANAGGPGESQTMRLGTQGKSGVEGSGILAAYIAGVATSEVTGSAVYVTASGKLGVLASSERFKTDIEPMGAASEKIAQLRPVTFKLRSDATGTTQYGLIAEEVAKVYPELVIRGADGEIKGIRYEELSPMLLNEVQRQQAAVRQQQAELAVQERRNAALAEEMSALRAEVAEARVEAQTLRELRAQIAELKSMMAMQGDAQPKDRLLAQRSAH